MIRTLLLWGALVLLLSAIAGCGDHHDHGEHEAHEHRDGEPEHTTIAAGAAAAAGIATEAAGPATLRETVALHGRVVPAADRFYRVAARYPGIVQSVAVQMGDSVAAGAPLAVVEGRDSLQRYTVKAPGAGVVLARHVNAGDAAGEGALFEIADLSRLWVELAAFPADLSRLAVGQSMRLRDAQGEGVTGVRLDWIAPALGDGQAATVRASLDNRDGRWRPGARVVAEITVAAVAVPLAVRAEAIQRIGEREVVFVRNGDEYEARAIAAGRRAGDLVEVLEGVAAGESYVTRNSFVVKADLLKAGVGHEH